MGRAVSWMSDADEESWCGRGVGLGRRRFTISAAPIAGPALETAGIHIAGDLRLDRRADLASRLGVVPRALSHLSDEALVALAWRRFGEDFARHLEGDFTLALWDADEETLALAQSPFPLQPLYWTEVRAGIAFATRVAALLTLDEVSPRLDRLRFAETFVPALVRHDPARTCFEGVNALPGGRVLIARRGELREFRYWPPDDLFRNLERPSRDWPEELRACLDESVSSRVRHLEHAACLLSGGLDSSSLACLAQRARERGDGPKKVTAFASVLGGDVAGESGDEADEDESRFIAAVVEHAGIDLVRVTPSADPSPYGILPVVFQSVEHPIGFREYLYAALYSAARDAGCRVVIDGSGGEVGPSNHGRAVYPWLLVHGRWLRLAREIFAYARREGRTAMSVLRADVVAPVVRGRRARSDSQGGIAGAFLESSPLRPEITASLRIDEHARTLGFGRAAGASSDPWREASRGLPAWQMPTNFFAPRFGVRSLFPFLDARVIACSLPLLREDARRDGWRRYPLRRAMEGVLPRAVAWRTTKGAFSPDYARRLERAMGEARARIETLSRSSLVVELLDPAALDRLVREAEDRLSRRGQREEPLAVKRLHRAIIAAEYLAWFEAL